MDVQVRRHGEDSLVVIAWTDDRRFAGEQIVYPSTLDGWRWQVSPDGFKMRSLSSALDLAERRAIAEAKRSAEAAGEIADWEAAGGVIREEGYTP